MSVYSGASVVHSFAMGRERCSNRNLPDYRYKLCELLEGHHRFFVNLVK
jgi:hypothetical protein